MLRIRIKISFAVAIAYQYMFLLKYSVSNSDLRLSDVVRRRRQGCLPSFRTLEYHVGKKAYRQMATET